MGRTTRQTRAITKNKTFQQTLHIVIADPYRQVLAAHLVNRSTARAATSALISCCTILNAIDQLALPLYYQRSQAA